MFPFGAGVCPTGAGVGDTVGPASPTKSNSLGEPLPGFVTLPGVALSMISSSTLSASMPVPSNSAAPPQTWGDAMEVPLMVLVSELLPIQAAVMPDPGAKISTQVPQLENEERPSALVVDPTVITVSSLAGE